MTNYIPLWTINKNILTGYRKKQEHKLGCFISIFNIHNETINIWTHLLSLSYFLFVFSKNFNKLNHILTLYEGVSIIVFGTSTIYHIYMPYTQQWFIILLKLDVYSIIINIAISNILIFYYWFWFYKEIRDIYMLNSFIYLSFGFTALLYIDIIKRYNYILLYFSIYSISIIISYYHINILTNGNVSEIIIYNFSKPFAFYGIGFIIYAVKMPEKIISNHFDIIGNSHQWWHIFSFLGAYFYHDEIIKYSEYMMINNRKY